MANAPAKPVKKTNSGASKKGKASADMGAGARHKQKATKNKKQALSKQKPSLANRLIWGQSKRWSALWFLHRFILFAVVIILVPLVLIVLYKPSFVHPISTLMIAQSARGEKINRQWVPFDKISPFVYQSVISSEDGQFCFHHGVDWGALNAVVDDLIEGERPRGASTITMQSAKNLFLWSDRSYLRKVLEIPLALMMDFIWGKKRLMEIYLNIAEWGPNIYGVEAAARHYFKRSAQKLTRRQAALLVVALPNPKTRNPRKPSRKLKQLARLIEKRARASGAYVRCLRP